MIEFENEYGTHTIENSGATILLILMVLAVLIGLSFGVGYMINKAAT